MKDKIESLREELAQNQKELGESRKEKESQVLALDRATDENFVKSGQINVETEQLKFISDQINKFYDEFVKIQDETEEMKD